MADTKVGERLGSRIFARLLSLDIACPSCGEVSKLGVGRANEGAWDKRTQRFNCGNCKMAMALGVIVYVPPKGRATPAWDQIPNARERQELRTKAVSMFAEGPRGESANVKVDET